MKNIAVIDDQKEILELLKEYLEGKGNYKVTTYQNPEIALQSYKADKYDLIFSDISMPKMNGLELLDKIVHINPHQKVCIMTAFSTLDKVLEAHEKGACNYIMKPIQLNEIDQKIKILLD
jgi:DNA-binding NtrC family response regulator